MDARAPTLEKVRNLGRRNGGGRRKRKGGGGENNRPEVFLVIVRFFLNYDSSMLRAAE